MARLYLFIIIVGVCIGAMLPTGPHKPSLPAGTFSSAGRPVLTVKAAEPVAAASVETGPWTTLYRAPNGHFFADAEVNGSMVHFLIDTGASSVALSADDARRVGLNFSDSDFEAVGSGASGELRGKMVTLDRVRLDGHEVQGVDGVILEGGDMSLLGQSFLAKMGSIEITGDRMVIR